LSYVGANDNRYTQNMIQINTKNILKETIGSGHGIAEKELSSFCKANAKLAKKISDSGNQADYAFSALPDDSDLIEKIKKFAADQKKNKWENIVVLGIGGSALGLIALREAVFGPLYNLHSRPRLFVLDNIDPFYTADFFSAIDAHRSLFIVISKSGTTVEPMVLYAIARSMFKNRTDAKKHFVFVTDPKEGLLRDIAEKDGIAAFDVPEKVGGRYSVLSAVGLLPAALIGIDIKAVMAGAKKMRGRIAESAPEKNPAFILAAAQYLMDTEKGKCMTVIMPYSNSLYRVADWYRQLLAESIGKNEKTGPTPIKALGTTDQHSQLQLYAEGPKNKLIIFLTSATHAKDPKIPNVLPKEIGYLNGKKMSEILDAAYKGTAESLARHETPNLTIKIPACDEENTGALFMLFEFQVAILGLLYKVDAFNQPGVEHSKQITKKLLSV
jgi:glucose-6-phosphate isomerase